MVAGQEEGPAGAGASGTALRDVVPAAVSPSISPALWSGLSCSCLLLAARWPNSVAFLCPNFTFSQHSRSEESKLLGQQDPYVHSPLAPRAYAWISHMAEEDEIPWLACVGSHALSSWEAGPGVPTRMAWNLRRVGFPEEVLLTKQN